MFGFAELLIRNGAGVNIVTFYTRRSPLHHAALLDADVCKLLLESSADVELEEEVDFSLRKTKSDQYMFQFGNKRAIDLAAESGHEEIFGLLSGAFRYPSLKLV